MSESSQMRQHFGAVRAHIEEALLQLEDARDRALIVDAPDVADRQRQIALVRTKLEEAELWLRRAEDER